jgi:hypothetical protein
MDQVLELDEMLEEGIRRKKYSAVACFSIMFDPLSPSLVPFVCWLLLAQQDSP